MSDPKVKSITDDMDLRKLADKLRGDVHLYEGDLEQAAAYLDQLREIKRIAHTGTEVGSFTHLDALLKAIC